MDPTFGARLRQQREERQVTLTAISTKTKIKLSLLEAFESDDLSAWPKGLFGRAYLRDYATAIGLDPEGVVSEFLSLHPEFAYVTPQVEEAEAAARADAARRGAAGKLFRFVSSAFSAPALSTPRPETGSASLPAVNGTGSHDRDASEILGTSMLPELSEAAEFASHANDFSAETAGLAALPDETTIQDRCEPLDTAVGVDAFEDRPADEPAPSLERDVPAGSDVGPAREISLPAVADLCTRLARAIDFREVTSLLVDAATLLDAVGLIVWQWDARTTALRPSLACGYPESVLARLPGVRTDDANAVAAAFRSGEECVIESSAGPEAIVVPSLGVGGCVGVLALELRPGTRQRESICAFARILAAQLAMLLPAPEPVEA